MKSEEWNRRFPIGTRVRYYPIQGVKKYIETTTRSEAWELGHGVAVVKINGRTGGVALSHLFVVVDLRPGDCVHGLYED